MFELGKISTFSVALLIWRIAIVVGAVALAVFDPRLLVGYVVVGFVMLLGYSARKKGPAFANDDMYLRLAYEVAWILWNWRFPR